MRRAPWVRRKQRYEREAAERRHAESMAHLDSLRNLTAGQLAALSAALRAKPAATEPGAGR